MLLKKALNVFLIAVLVPAWALLAQPAEPPSPLVLILDASGSMWGQIGGENKIVIARNVLGELIDSLPEAAETGLIAYGHRREGDCEDIETVTPIGPLEKATLKKSIEALNPKGKTPITRSVEEAFDLLRGRDGGATVILVSDGLETCGGDPCATVRAAKERGVEFLLHVVGFDVAGEDVSQLECTAQAGGGLFLSAENAGELAAALDAAVALPVDAPVGRLVVKAIADDELFDASIAVARTDTGESVARARTYRGKKTNPSSIPLPDGKYTVQVKALGLKGEIERHLEVEIAEGETVEKEVDFSTGELSIGVTRNGELSDAVYHVYVAGTKRVVAQGRTYTAESSNPSVVRITAGSYDVEVGTVEIAGRPKHSLGRIDVEPRRTVELSHAFQSGELTVGAVLGDELVDVVVRVRRLEDGKQVAQSRTYKTPGSNPRTYVLEPGKYRVELKSVGLEGRPRREIEVTVESGKNVSRKVDFSSPTQP